MTMLYKKSQFENLCLNLSLTPSQTSELWEYFCQIFSRPHWTQMDECGARTTSEALNLVNRPLRLIDCLLLRMHSDLEQISKTYPAKSLNLWARLLQEELPRDSEIRIVIRTSGRCSFQIQVIPSSMAIWT